MKNKGDIVSRVGHALVHSVRQQKLAFEERAEIAEQLEVALERYKIIVKDQLSLLEMLEAISGREKEAHAIDEDNLIALVNSVTIGRNLDVFLQVDLPTIERFLNNVDDAVLRTAIGNLPEDRQEKLFPSSR